MGNEYVAASPSFERLAGYNQWFLIQTIKFMKHWTEFLGVSNSAWVTTSVMETIPSLMYSFWNKWNIPYHFHIYVPSNWYVVYTFSYNTNSQVNTNTTQIGLKLEFCHLHCYCHFFLLDNTKLANLIRNLKKNYLLRTILCCFTAYTCSLSNIRYFVYIRDGEWRSFVCIEQPVYHFSTTRKPRKL